MAAKLRISIQLLIVLGLLISQFPTTPRLASARPLTVPASITGRVTDGLGNGVSGVTVIATPAFGAIFMPLMVGQTAGAPDAALPVQTVQTTSPYTTKTGADGTYSLSNLLAGSYTLTVSKDSIPFTPSYRIVILPVSASIDFEVQYIQPEIPATTEVISAETNQYLMAVSEDGAVLTFSQTTPDLQALEPGDVIVSGVSETMPNGYLRKVIAVTDQAGSVQVETEPAVLEEAVQNGSAFLQDQLTPADVTQSAALPGVTRMPAVPRSSTFSYQINNVVLYDEDGKSSTTNDRIKANGKIEFELAFDCYANIQNFELRNLTFSSQTTLRKTIEIEAEIELASLKEEQILIQHYFAPMTVMIGAFPLVFIPVLEVLVGVDGSVKAGISTSVSQELSLRSGVEYINPAGWRPIGEIRNSYTFKAPHLSMEAKVKGYAGVRFNLYLYGTAGPFVKITPFLELSVKPLETPWWVLSAGVEVPAGFKVSDEVQDLGGWIGLRLDAIEFKVIEIKHVIAQAQTANHKPDQPSSPLPDNGATGVSITPTLSWIGTDPDEEVLNYMVLLEAWDPSPDVLAADKLYANSFNPVPLAENTTYYWQINAVDPNGWSQAGPVWSFTTKESDSPPPTVDVKINDSDGPLTLTDQDTFTVTWSSANATECTGSSSMLGRTGLSGSFSAGPLADGSYTYAMTCSSGARSSSDQVQIQVGVVVGSTGSTIAAGEQHTCALTQAGGVKCWGRNDFGQLGDGSLEYQRLTAVDVVGLSSGISAIAAGRNHTCALTQAGGVKCWGPNDFGQLGDGSYNNLGITPVDVVGLSAGVSAISAGVWHTCALTQAGGVKCWGSNFYGQLGDGTNTDRYTAVDVVGLSSGVSAISAGGEHTCALTQAGIVKCWGSNIEGQMGDLTETDRWTPVDVVGLSAGVSAITAGGRHTCALTQAGGIKCWGLNSTGQLGDGTYLDSLSAVEVVGLSAGVIGISADVSHTCALTQAGEVKCWGRNGFGQLGDNTNITSGTPVDVVDLSTSVTAITTGGHHTCALIQVGGIKCWGSNFYGQIGDGTNTDRWTPVDVVGFP